MTLYIDRPNCSEASNTNSSQDDNGAVYIAKKTDFVHLLLQERAPANRRIGESYIYEVLATRSQKSSAAAA